MRKIVILFALAILGTSPACASEETAVMAAVNQFVDGFNQGDLKSASAACAEQMSVIDEFPPHEWQGDGALTNWMNDFDSDARKNGITDPVVKLGKARHVDVTVDRAYVVLPANYTFKQKGKEVKETGSILTIVLQKGATGWRITAWAWAKN